MSNIQTNNDDCNIKPTECSIKKKLSKDVLEIVCAHEQTQEPAHPAENSESVMDKALKTTQANYPQEPLFAQIRLAAFYLGQQGLFLESSQLYTSAIDEYKKILNIFGDQQQRTPTPEEVQELIAMDPVNAEILQTYSDFLPFCFNEVGILSTRHGRVYQAVMYFDEALQNICHNLKYGDVFGNKNPRHKSLLLETKKHMACALKAAGERDISSKLFSQLIDTYRSCPVNGCKLLLSDCTYHLAELLNSEGKFVEAEPLIRECVELRRELFGHNGSATLDACSSTTGQCPSGKKHAKILSAPSDITEIALALCLLSATIASPELRKYDEAEQALAEAMEITAHWRGDNTCTADSVLKLCDSGQCELIGRKKCEELKAMSLLMQNIRTARTQDAACDMRDEDDDLVDINADL